MMPATFTMGSALAMLSARIDKLVGVDSLHTSVMRQVNRLESAREQLATATEIAGAMPGDYRIDILYRRQLGTSSMVPVLK